MVKKKGGYARKNKQRNAGNAGLSRPLVLADEDSGQRYARVLRALGDGRFSVALCTIGSDGAPRAWNAVFPASRPPSQHKAGRYLAMCLYCLTNGCKDCKGRR